MAITEQLEERIATHRGRTRQNRAVPLLIRDDGVLMPNVPLIAKKPNFRPYHGDPAATLEERMQYLAGFRHQRRIVNTAPDVEEIDIGAMDKETLINFAKMEFDLDLDEGEHLNTLRSKVAKAAGLDAREAQRPKGKTQATGLSAGV